MTAEASALRLEVGDCKAEARKEAARSAKLRAELASRRVRSTTDKRAIGIELEDTFQSHSRRILTILSVMQLPASETLRQEGWLDPVERAFAAFDAELAETQSDAS
mmetsp:Transcript_42493/g.97373  ORF Transcript_42493/g.97373 Transcript_42493/m.97373 type:complete len:106 (+) Transcript_42493:3-320(+)